MILYALIMAERKPKTRLKDIEEDALYVMGFPIRAVGSFLDSLANTVSSRREQYSSGKRKFWQWYEIPFGIIAGPSALVFGIYELISNNTTLGLIGVGAGIVAETPNLISLGSRMKDSIEYTREIDRIRRGNQIKRRSAGK